MERSAQREIQDNQYSFPYHYLSLHSDIYRRVRHILYLGSLEAVKEQVGPFVGQRLLDAGCGGGRFCYQLRGERVSVVGIDYSERAVAFARAFNPGVQFIIGDLTDLPPAEPFDCVTMIEVLEHIVPEQCDRVVAGLARMLKPGGRLVISVPNDRVPVSAKHYRHFSPATLCEALKSHFEVDKLVDHCRLGLTYRRFQRRKRIAELVWPWRYRFQFVDRYIAGLESLYLAMRTCEPSEGCQIIGTFHKAR